MRPLILAVLMSFIALHSLAQSKPLTISGNIQFDQDSSKFDIYTLKYRDLFSGKYFVTPLNLDQDGNFKIHLPVSEMQEIKFEREVYLKKSKKLISVMSFFDFYGSQNQFIAFNFKHINHQSSLNFMGDFATENNQYYQFNNTDFVSDTTIHYMEKAKKLNGDYSLVKKNILTGLYQNINFFKDYDQKNNLKVSIKNQINNNIRYYAANQIIDFVGLENMTDSLMYDLVESVGVKLSNPDALGNLEYQKFLADNFMLFVKKNISFIDYKNLYHFSKEKNTDLPDKDLQVLLSISKGNEVSNAELQSVRGLMNDYDNAVELERNFQFFSGLDDSMLRDIYITMSLYKKNNAESFYLLEPYIEKYKSLIRNEQIKNQFLNSYSKIISNKDVKLSEKSIFYNAKDLNNKDLVNSIIGKYKGKTVYIDIWATWCGPCLEEMKSAVTLRNKLKGENVVFVYLCLNSNSENLWKSLIAKEKIEGENYFLDIEQSKIIKANFDLKAFPQYVLVNKKGEVVNKHAGAPSKEETLDQIKEFN